MARYYRNIAVMDKLSNAIISAVDQVKNSVVRIDISKKSKRRGEQGGSGSGFIFSSDGYVFTNSHVVHGADKIMVTLLDGSREEGFLIGEDPDSDLAVIKIYPQLRIFLRHYLSNTVPW